MIIPDWDMVSGGAVRIDVGPSGVPWVTNDDFSIFKRSGTSWTSLPGSARDISVGSDGVAWAVGEAAETGGHMSYRYNSSMNICEPTSRIGVAASSGISGKPWIGDIFRNRW